MSGFWWPWSPVRGYSSVRLERTPDKGEVAGSIPASPTQARRQNFGVLPTVVPASAEIQVVLGWPGWNHCRVRVESGNPASVGASCSASSRQPTHHSDGEVLVRMIRRALVALGVAALVAAVLRLRGSGGVPPTEGGWRELDEPDLT